MPPTAPAPWTSTVRPAGSSEPNACRKRRADAVEDAERGVDARIAGAAVARRCGRRRTRVRVADHVHVGLARVHVRAGDEAAAERVDQLRRSARAGAAARRPPVPTARRARPCRRRTEGPAPRACGSSRPASRIPSSSASAGVAVPLHPRAAHRRAEPRRVDADEHPGAARLRRSGRRRARRPTAAAAPRTRSDSTRRGAPREAARGRRRASRPRRRARAARGRARGSPKPSPGASATRASVSSRSQVQPLGQPQPDEERALAARLEQSEGRDDAVAARLVQRAALGHRLLRAGQRRDPGALQRDEDPGADVLLQPGHAGDQLGVAETKPSRQPAMP